MEKIDARKLPPEALEHIRRQAFVLRKQGYTWTHISEVCGFVGTVLKWARRAQADDLDAVIKGGQRGRRHGSGRTLTLVQEEQLPGPSHSNDMHFLRIFRKIVHVQ